jgi:hypothetical protein
MKKGYFNFTLLIHIKKLFYIQEKENILMIAYKNGVLKKIVRLYGWFCKYINMLLDHIQIYIDFYANFVFIDYLSFMLLSTKYIY